MIKILLLIFCLGLEARDESLSCSKSGTTILYINGMANDEIKVVIPNKDYLRILIGQNNPRIDNKSIVSVDFVYNTTEGFLKDALQLLGQKLEGQKENHESYDVAIEIGRYLFRKQLFIARFGLQFTSLIYKELLAKEQNHQSRVDLRNMISRIKSELINDKKVILVSHSHGNIYANMAYDALVREGFDKELLNKYLGNVQVASTASSIKIKNHVNYTFHQDIAILALREFGAHVVPATFSLEAPFACLMDQCHDFRRNYMGETVYSSGLRAGRETLRRIGSKIIIDSIEEVAWKLANNDPDCCEGRDGRFYRKDYKSEPGGFVEDTVDVHRKAKLTVSKESQVCGTVWIDEEKSDVKILGTSEIHAFHPISLNGKVSLNNTMMTNYTHPDGASYFGSKDGHGIVLTDSFFHDGVTVEGDLMAGNTTTYGSPEIISNSVYDNYLGQNRIPLISNVELRGEETELKKYFFLNRFNGEDIKVEGTFPQTPGKTAGSMAIDPKGEHEYSNVTFNGIGIIKGKINAGVVINGYPVEGLNHGVSITSDVHLLNNATLSGSLYLEGVTFNGSWSGAQLVGGEHVGNAVSSHITNAVISGAPSIHSSVIGKSGITNNSTSISGKPVIIGAELYGCSVSGNAYVSENASDKSMGQGYVSETKNKIDVMERMLDLKAESEKQYFETLAYYQDRVSEFQ